MIGRALLPLFLWLGLASCTQERADRPAGHPALWVVADETGQPVGWLFGTVHALPDGVDWRFAALADVTTRADMLVVEVGNLEDTAAVQAAFRRMAYDRAPDAPVSARIDPAYQADYRRFAAASSGFDDMETWAAALALAQSAQTGDIGNGVDRALIGEFSTRPVVELEGAARQFAIFDALPEKEQRDFLNAVLKEAGDRQADDGKIAAAWRSGDLAAMEQLTATGMLADPELRRFLLTDRNRAWAVKITQLLASGRRPLVAVGAAHMLGPEGLPALLVEAGFTVTRVP